MTKVVETKTVSGDAPANAASLDVVHPYSTRTTGRLVPRRFEIHWERRDDGVWQLSRLSVSGPKLKKSGEPGLNEGTSSFVDSQVIPDWLDVEVKRSQP